MDAAPPRLPLAALQLVALGPDDFVGKYQLPVGGSLCIGRGPGVEIDLPDRSVSRQHARLHVGPGPEFFLEDLGSANGTQVGRAHLGAGERVRLEVGEVAFVGRTIAFLQPAQAVPAVPRPVAAEGLEARLAAWCAAPEVGPAGATTAGCLLLLELLDGSLGEPLARETAGALGPGDLFVDLGAGQLALLLQEDRDGGPAAALAQRRRAMLDACARLGPGVAWGEASFPQDGRAPATLLARARERLEAACLAVDPDDQIVFCDPRMLRLYELGRHAAAGLINVLLLGETGVGKDVFARAIHRLSPRREQAFARIECAALTEALAESELFGHARGAFTGALRDKPGLLEAADGGTVFLDEVGELPPRLQAKLLHVLETRQLTRVGAVDSRTVDLRFIAATNRDLEAESRGGTFRRDLYYRLCGFTLAIPPLRERPADILPLARAMVRQSCRRLGRTSIPALGAAAVARLAAHRWPGNVRELRNAVERAVLVCQGETGASIEPQHLLLGDDAGPFAATAPVTPPPPVAAIAPAPAPPPARPPAEVGDEADKRRIEEALAACGGNQSRAAKLLGMARSTLVLRLEAYGITRPRKR
jgi:two-component system, NtrC family, response regulator AtoC